MTPTVGSWSLPPEKQTLGNHDVHVWFASLDLDETSVHRLWRTLSADERTRAKRFHFRRDRERFIVGRGLLRSILCSYLATEPERLRFCYDPHGKPHLTSDCGGKTVCFNLSHAQGLALYAVTRHRRIGVDLEYIRSDLVDEQVAERFFAPREVAALHALPASMREQAFFACWTRKEAYIKASGAGLSIPLDQFEVSLQPGEPVRLVSREGDPDEASRWSLKELHPGLGFVAALCVEGHGWELRCLGVEQGVVPSQRVAKSDTSIGVGTQVGVGELESRFARR